MEMYSLSVIGRMDNTFKSMSESLRKKLKRQILHTEKNAQILPIVTTSGFRIDSSDTIKPPDTNNSLYV